MCHSLSVNMNGSIEGPGESFTSSPHSAPGHRPHSASMLQRNIMTEPRVVARNSCPAWDLFVQDTWPTLSQDITPLRRRQELIHVWADSEQSFRDEYVMRTRRENIHESRSDYLPDIPRDNFRRKLSYYPCIRPPITEADKPKWAKLELVLKLDEHLSPLHETELPPILYVDETFNLEEYSSRYIFQESNFSLMGMSDAGRPIVYYHILMIVDEQSFRDGTLLHVDFDQSGAPANKLRHPAIDSYLPWCTHQTEHLGLVQLLDQLRNDDWRREHTIMDFTKSAVAILREEMESRGIPREESTLHELAVAAVTTVNPNLL
ncbi:hypothetical protein DFH27DRAFT_305000 [Peziza echinospora]|nr:hypothetical protein DFH27DRAFT_305000 [Peziza echinospora]